MSLTEIAEEKSKKYYLRKYSSNRKSIDKSDEHFEDKYNLGDLEEEIVE